jgi:hypothetical protein
MDLKKNEVTNLIFLEHLAICKPNSFTLFLMFLQLEFNVWFWISGIHYVEYWGLSFSTNTAFAIFRDNASEKLYKSLYTVSGNNSGEREKQTLPPLTAYCLLYTRDFQNHSKHTNPENGNYNACWNTGEPSVFSVTYSWEPKSYIKFISKYGNICLLSGTYSCYFMNNMHLNFG